MQRGAGIDGRGLLVLGLVVLVVAGAVVFRKPLVGMAPGLASLYARAGLPVNRVGIDFEAVSTGRDVEDGTAGIVVEGTLRNVTSGDVDVPPVRLVLLDAGGKDVKSWSATPEKSRLAGRETLKFRTRIAAPPDSARRVSVSFALAATE